MTSDEHLAHARKLLEQSKGIPLHGRTITYVMRHLRDAVSKAVTVKQGPVRVLVLPRKKKA